MLHAFQTVSCSPLIFFLRARMAAKHKKLRDGAFLHVTLAALPNIAGHSQALERVASRQLTKWLSLHCLASTPILSVLSDTFMRMNGRQNVTAEDAGKARMEVASIRRLRWRHEHASAMSPVWSPSSSAGGRPRSGPFNL